MAAAQHPVSAFLPSSIAWRRDPRCFSGTESAEIVNTLAGRWQVAVSLGQSFTRYGRRKVINLATNPCGRLRIAGQFPQLIRPSTWVGCRNLCLIWRSGDGRQCIVGRPARGDALILSRDRDLSNEDLFHHINFLRSQGFSLRDLTTPG